MDNMSVVINTAYKKPLMLSQASSVDKPVTQNKDATGTGEKVQQSVNVELSDEAKKKSLQDSNQQALRKLMGKEDIDGVEGSDDKQTLDEMIAALQEEIAQLTQEMVKLRSQGDESSVNEAKSLEMQIASLTAQLMDLLTQKVEQDKSQ
ncbi:hypothetical protein [Psychromonas hadalis]|uniref:hypothetical protein n=1 Tax=Psychromonas hadalis TaxID=211669 RepID=UPI0003B63899|nr:hypothetical protein [Psychromonas hadalis]